MDQLSPAVMNSFVHVAVSDSVSVHLLDISVKSSKYWATVPVQQILHFLFLILHTYLHCPSLSPHCLSATTLTCSGWWSGRPGWWAARMTWRVPAMSGFLLSVWRIHGCSVFTSSCVRRICLNTAQLPWDTPGLMFSLDCNFCSHWLTPSMWEDRVTILKLSHIIERFKYLTLSSLIFL